MELQSADHSRKKLLHTFNSTNISDSLKDSDHDYASVPHEQQESPTFSNSRISRHRSICMENQLELNESEIVYYEAIVEDLVDKLSQMKQEKEDLQSICNSLGDRLQKIGKDSEDKVHAIKTELENEKAILLADVHRLSEVKI